MQLRFLQATHRPVRDFSFFFEHLIASSAATPPHHFPARSSSISLLPPRGSSTSSFTGASHLLSVSKPTYTRVSSRLLRLRSSLVWDPLFTHPVASYYSLLTCLFSLWFAGTFPTRFNRTVYRHLDTQFIWTLEPWFILFCHVSFYIVLVYIFTIQICIVFIMSHVLLGMLTHLCLVTCPKVMITLLCP